MKDHLTITLEITIALAIWLAPIVWLAYLTLGLLDAQAALDAAIRK